MTLRSPAIRRPLIGGALAMLAALSATGVSALSCMRPDMVLSYEQARDASEPYIVVRGQAVGANKVPRPERSGPKETEGTMRLTGHSLTSEGFTTEFNTTITVRMTCLDMWCPGPPTEAPAVFFLQRTDAGYLLHQTACPRWVVRDNDPEQIARLLACHQKGRCNTP